MQAIAATIFRLTRLGRCPTCGAWTRFSAPEPVTTGPVPAELQGLVPRICRCRRNGCTSSERAITSLELRTATPEA